MNKEFEVTDEMCCSSGKRILNYIIDMVVIYAIIFLLMIIALFITTLIGTDRLAIWMSNISDGEAYLLIFGIFFPYYTFMEYFFSKTVSKFITQSKVVMEDGSTPSLGTAFKRPLCRLIPLEFISFFGAYSRGWHDSITGSYVVNSKDFDSQMKQFYEFDQIGKQVENE